ncbi:MAG: lipopolysaccharide biosynthesis protein [Piscinibacter sp.]|uniref:lipopolysaccharide biosynthesis protein n=1 Tax=Piscinibacter sp. TaxID=1903157 RepID=UPI003D111B17
MSLLGTAVHAFKWSLLGEAASRLVGPLVFIILARVLAPQDFGVVAAATVAISFSEVFWFNGLSRALIQHPDDNPAAADAVFWINLALAAVLAVALLLAAPALAWFFGDPRVADVLRWLCLQIPLAAACSVMTALMQKRFQFARLFWIRIASTAGPGLASIPLALSGWGYWALVAGVLVGQMLQLLLLWHFSQWRPRARIDRALSADLLRFGRWSLLSGLLGWLYGWLDAIVVGHFLGSEEMGLYRTGNTFVTVVFGMVFAPLMPVLFSLFSRAQHDVPRLREALITVAHAIALLALPIGMGLYALREDVGAVVFGAQWTGVGTVIGLLAISHAIGWIAGANGELYRAVGKPYVETFTMALMIVVYVPVYLFAIRSGLQAFLDARVALSALALLAHVVVSWRVIDIEPRRWVRSCVWAGTAAGVAALLVRWLDRAPEGLASGPLLAAMAGVLAYGAMILLLEFSFLQRLWSILRTRSPAQPAAELPRG